MPVCCPSVPALGLCLSAASSPSTGCNPTLPIRFSPFIFPTATLILTVTMWWFSRDPQHPDQIASLKEDRLTLIVVAATVLLLSLERLLPPEWRFISAARPPDPFAVLIALVAAFLIVAAIDRLTRQSQSAARVDGLHPVPHRHLCRAQH